MNPADDDPIKSLGPRLRAARKARGLSQEALAAPDFTKSYVSAVERGKARPSLKALGIMASRLELSLASLLPAPAAADPAAAEAALAAQIDQARILLYQHEGAAATRVIAAATAAAEDQLPEFSPRTRLELGTVRGLAALESGDPGQARQLLTAARPLAAELDNTTAARRHAALGTALLAEGLFDAAREVLEEARATVEGARAPDPATRLAVYQALVKVYAALGLDAAFDDLEQAAGELLGGAADLPQQARFWAGRSQAASAAEDAEEAHRAAQQALLLYGIIEQRVVAAQIALGLADRQIAQGAYDRATELLGQAQTLLTPTGDTAALSSLYEHYARLALERDQLETADECATQSVALAVQAAGADPAAGRRAQAQALRTAGMIAERQGRSAAADAAFAQTLALLEAPGAADLASRVELTYADILTARGDHAAAAAHYQAAFRHQGRRPGL